MTEAIRTVLAALQDTWAVTYTAELVRRPSVNPPGDYAAVQGALERVRAEDPELVLGDLIVTEERDPLEFAPDNPLVRAMQAAGKVLGREIGLGGWYSSGEPYPVSTGGHIANGLVIGPGEPWQAHACDEHIPVRDLQEAARLYAVTALTVCGIHP